MSKKSDMKKVISETILLYKQKAPSNEVKLQIQKLQQQLDIIDNLIKSNEKKPE
mgnify:CR=1 FL=1|jgi:hypothetical protein